MLKVGKFNHRLLSELICHRDFQRFMLDAEIYIGRLADMQIKDMNTLLCRNHVTKSDCPPDAEKFLPTAICPYSRWVSKLQKCSLERL